VVDGGGVRGLSSLIILKYLMKRLNPQKPPKPCEYFDLIGGTSTGGLIAIMLGRLQMDIDSCITAYLDLSSVAFRRKRHKANIFGRANDAYNVKGTYSSEDLERVVKELVKSVEGDSEAKLASSNRCKT
jgi:patatin-like phospholipase/acyl hydrolase